jgi:hypothetical protein
MHEFSHKAAVVASWRRLPVSSATLTSKLLCIQQLPFARVATGPVLGASNTCTCEVNIKTGTEQR